MVLFFFVLVGFERNDDRNSLGYLLYVESCALSELGLMVFLLQELVRVCCSTRAFMVFEMKERMGI